MDPVTGAAIISGGASVLGNAYNVVSTERQNKKNREFQEKMWNKTNEYNTPLNQRLRLEAAGLNPALMYGSSQSGGTAAMPGNPDTEAPQIDLSQNPIETYYNLKQQKAGLEAVETRNELVKQETYNAGIEGLLKALNFSDRSIDYRKKQELYSTAIRTAEEQLRSLSIGNQYTEDKNRREEVMVSKTVDKLGAEIKNLDLDSQMKKINLELWENYRVRPGDPMWMRILTSLSQQGILDKKVEFKD